MSPTGPLVLIRGGGDLATGVAARLHRTGFQVAICEIEHPLTVRRTVSLAEAVYAREVHIEDLVGRKADDLQAARAILADGQIPVLVDPQADCRLILEPVALVDGRMRKRPPGLGLQEAPMTIGLGPGFEVGVDCHAVVETNRGHYMGRLYWHGSAQADTGVPDSVTGYDVDRVLRAPASGRFEALAAIGSRIQPGDRIARVDGRELIAPFAGVLRGLLHDGLQVQQGVKVGDLDPRGDPAYCGLISDKSLAIGGGVLEALLSRPAIRRALAG